MAKNCLTLLFISVCLLMQVKDITGQDYTAGSADYTAGDYTAGSGDYTAGSGDVINGGSDYSWDISWNREFSFDIETPFSEPGVILPGLDTMSLIRIIGDATRTNTTKEALADFCRNLGPLLNYLAGDRIDVESICKPILKATHDGTDLEGVDDVCIAVWERMDDHHLDNEHTEEYGSGDVDTGSGDVDTGSGDVDFGSGDVDTGSGDFFREIGEDRQARRR